MAGGVQSWCAQALEDGGGGAEITFGGGHASHHVTEVNHQRPPVQYRSSPSNYRPSSAVKPPRGPRHHHSASLADLAHEVYSSRTKLPSEKYPGLIYVRLGLLGWAIDRGGATQWCVQAWVAGGQGSDGWGLIFELDMDFGAGDGSLGAVRGA